MRIYSNSASQLEILYNLSRVKTDSSLENNQTALITVLLLLYFLLLSHNLVITKGVSKDNVQGTVHSQITF